MRYQRYIQKKPEKQSAVHKLLHKLSCRGQGPKTELDLIEGNNKTNEPVNGILKKLKLIMYLEKRNKS